MNLENRVKNYVNNTSLVILTFIICLLTLFFSTPPFDSLFIDETWNAIFKQIINPLSPIEAPAWSHNSKLTFRLFPVLIGKLFSLNKIGFMISLFVVGFLIILTSFSFLISLIKDRYRSFLLTLSFSLIYAGKCSFLEFRGIFDGYAILFLLLSVFYKNSISIYFFILFAAFTDERALIASGFIFLHYLFLENERPFYKNKYLFSICLSWICYFLIRYILIIYFGFKTSTGGITLNTLANNFELFPFSIFSLFEGFWIIIIFFYRIFFSISKFNFFLFIIMLFLVLTISYLVVDVSRSLVYGSTFIFIAISFITKHKPTLISTKFCVIVLAISFLFPCYVVAGNHISWVKPIFLEILFRFFTNS